MIGMRRKAQGSLEYIIIIGGILIIAAAAYFMVKGFQQSTQGDTSGNIMRIGTSQLTELENMGRTLVSATTPSWGEPDSQNQYDITLTKTGSEGTITFGLNSTNLSGSGVDTGTLTVGYQGSWNVLSQTVNGDWYEYTAPSVGLGDSITIYLYFNNTSSYAGLANVHTTSADASVSQGTAYARSDLSPPSLVILDPPLFNLGDVISFSVDADANSGFTIARARYRLNTSTSTSEWIDVDGMAYSLNIGPQDIIIEGLIDGYGDEQHEDITIQLKGLETTGSYALEVEVTDDTWLTNATSKTIDVTQSGGGTYTP